MGLGPVNSHCLYLSQSLLPFLLPLSRFVFLLDRGLDIYVWRGAQATLSSTTKTRYETAPCSDLGGLFYKAELSPKKGYGPC